MESGKVEGVAFDVDPPSSISDSWEKLVSHDNENNALAGKSFKGALNAPNIDVGKRGELMP
uniref:Beta-tubulin n=1 Tax=Peronospora matthiolae TaxID=2874970 RepID=A0AAV1UE58_9STRA